MANELRVSASLEFEKSGERVSRSRSARLTIAGSKFVELRQTVAITEEALLLGDIAGASLGYVLIENKDPANFITIRAATGASDLIKVKAGMVALFELTATAPFVIANTAPCDIVIILIER